MKALLIVNPASTAMSPRARDVAAAALSRQTTLDVVNTQKRGHAIELARQAADDGFDVLVAMGGDGTVNEVVNGALASTASAPLIAAVPAGSTNVFARALGMPRDAIDATGMLLEALDARRSHVINLGRVGERYFTFCVGFGFDARVVARVEGKRRQGKRASPSLYLMEILQQYFSGIYRPTPWISVTVRGDANTSSRDMTESPFARTIIVQNTNPLTYLWNREISPSPKASFSRGLDIFGLRSISGWPLTKVSIDLLRHVKPHGPNVVHLTDRESFTLTAEVPLAFQVDGEYLGESTQLELFSIPRAISVVV